MSSLAAKRRFIISPGCAKNRWSWYIKSYQDWRIVGATGCNDRAWNWPRAGVANRWNVRSQKPLYRTRFMLDELGNLQSDGHGIANFQTMLSIGLGQEQQFTLILQTLQQLRDVYGVMICPQIESLPICNVWVLLRELRLGRTWRACWATAWQETVSAICWETGKNAVRWQYAEIKGRIL